MQISTCVAHSSAAGQLLQGMGGRKPATYSLQQFGRDGSLRVLVATNADLKDEFETVDT